MTLAVQNWLKESNGDFAKLEEQLGIFACFHPEDDRVILNYSQIDSPKTNDIVRECRGLVLNKKDYSLISRGFRRFFNWGEHKDEMFKFHWESCYGYHKEDGSFLNVKFWNDEWRIHTRGSFASGLINNTPITWEELAYKAIGSRFFDNADKDLTYIFELCSVYNKVVRTYKEPQAYLLTTFVDEQELVHEVTEEIGNKFKLSLPEVRVFDDIADVQVYLHYRVEEDKTFEGIVVRDKDNRRFKVKSPWYIQLSHLINNHAVTNERLLKIVLESEIDEVLCYFPEISSHVLKIKEHVEYWQKDIPATYDVFKDMKDQKQFALAVKDYEYASVLFEARKTGNDPVEIFRKSPELILKKLESSRGKKR